MIPRALVWLRRDYRLVDHQALLHAMKQSQQVYVCFVYDPHILSQLDPDDRRISFIMDAIRSVDAVLNQYGSRLIVRYGPPEEKIPEIIQQFNINALFFNRDYEPYAVLRDTRIATIVSVPVHTVKDSVMVEKDEIRTNQGGYYTVFTPFKKKWLSQLNAHLMAAEPPRNDFTGVFGPVHEESSIQETRWFNLMGFTGMRSAILGGREPALRALEAFKSTMHAYHETRNYPGLNGTSQLSPYIRFGCLSIRECISAAMALPSPGADVWLSELIWRDFYQMVCATHPTCDTQAIKPAYDAIEWEGREAWFRAWCDGQTGYPIVDAAMRQLNQTGFMHNRCRMIVASFLCKTLLIDWRKGESYFAKQLLDFDFASNNGGWQWSSSSGCDAQPYFRIFNPYAQSERFDSNGDYIRDYCPELRHLPNRQIHCPPVLSNYPSPIVDYKTMRQRALAMYAVVQASSTDGSGGT